MRNIDIFTLLHEPHTSRLVQGFDSVNSGACSIGVVKGQCRQLNAILTESATEEDQWRIVNLKGSINSIAAFDSVAVLGAVDNDHASALAQMQFGRMFDAIEDDVIETNTNGLLRHLATPQFHKHKQLIHRDHLVALQDIPCAVLPGWDGIELTTHEGKTANLLLDMQLHDDNTELLSSFDGLANLLESIGAEHPDFDSIIVEYQYLDKLMDMLHTAMQTASKGGVKVLNVDRSEKPFRHKKVLNVAVSYDFEDGQSITILFHNPDRDAKRISPQDTLLSWKILMNKRDVTGVVQPNQGEGIALPVLAGRVVKLINQNSARFKRTQAKKADNAQALADAEQRIADKQNQKTAFASEIQGLLDQIDGLNKQNNGQAPNADTGTADDADQSANTKAVTKAEARQIYDALDIRHRWLTGGTTEEFYNQNYPAGISEALTDAKNLLERPFGKVALANGLKDSIERMIATVEKTIERWNKGLSEDSSKAKTYPPIENLGNGYYRAFKNDKKLDDWTAHINTNGEWEVSANNASSRAWRNGYGAPRFFKTIEEMIAKYPAFAALPAMLPASSLNVVDTRQQDEALLTKGMEGVRSAMVNKFGWEYSHMNDGGFKHFSKDISVTFNRDKNTVVAEYGDIKIKRELLPQYGTTIQTEENYQAIAKKLNDAVEQWVANQIGNNPDDTGNVKATDDADYLNKVIKGEVDFSKASEVESQLESIGSRLTPETNDLFEQAVSAYSMYQVNQAASVN